ncbi:uncharacterized protein LOC144511934 [Mustelus asterias]
MATQKLFEGQTEYLVNFLLQDDDDPDIGFRCSEDPVEDSEALRAVGQRLRQLGDLINQEHLDSFTRDFQRVAAQQAIAQACELFSDTVNQICKERANGNLSIELNLLKVTASLGTYVAQKMPALVNEIKTAMASFINTKLQKGITEAGGWANVQIE